MANSETVPKKLVHAPEAVFVAATQLLGFVGIGYGFLSKDMTTVLLFTIPVALSIGFAGGKLLKVAQER